MKTNPDPDNQDPLLEAVLRDEDWQTAGKARALGVFAARQRVRRMTRRIVGLAALALGVAFAAHWLTEPPQRLAIRTAEPSAQKPGKEKYLTDSELLALFPEGSCFLAEVDGKKKLVFFDPAVEREYVSNPAP